MDFKKWTAGGVDWTDVIQGRGKLRALLNRAMILRVLYNEGNFLPG